MSQEKANINLTNWDIVGVNPNDKNWTWGDMFCFWAINIQSLIGFSLVASLYLVYDLNILIVFLSCLLTGLLVAIFANLVGSPSQKYGLPFPVILRSSFGIGGARYVALLRGIVGIFMFGVRYFIVNVFRRCLLLQGTDPPRERGYEQQFTENSGKETREQSTNTNEEENEKEEKRSRGKERKTA